MVNMNLKRLFKLCIRYKVERALDLYTGSLGRRLFAQSHEVDAR
jgi:hypothetical protein